MADNRVLKIMSVGARGDGVSEGPDGPVYAPLTLPGEHVRADVSEERAHVLEWLRQSPDRREPVCSHFGVCGGCALQHWDVEAYRVWKRERIGDALARVGVEAHIAPCVDACGDGRRRASFHGVRAKAVGFVFGFAERGQSRIVDLAMCPVLCPELEGAREGLRRLAELLLPKAGRVDVQVNRLDTGLDVDARGGRIDAEAVSAIAVLAEAEDWARVSLKGDVAVSRRPARLSVGSVEVSPPPGAFLQATYAGETVLAELVVNACAGAERVLDLFSGWGAFALRLARRAEVRAADGDGPAIAALRDAVKRSPGLKPVTAFVRDLSRNPLGYREVNWADCVVFDPPRAGAAHQVQAIAKSRVSRVIAVSCNPATFARDARTLVEAGFALDAVTPVDQFLYSAHVELVGVFTR